ncbi:hypothetical protein [Hyalangium sp.]|uniref:hypothetical protein n=1 Tax=Hyalangium sp. TaxID=2028555 RepID=UPI002D5E0EE2|nr:hypothetical protein [Hyalangium sp.]HYI00571.1 hypothetical protein [Hyalangium sp.]
MRITIATANTDGKFSIGAGQGFLVIPFDKGAVFPLEVHVNGNVSRFERLDEERPLFLSFTDVEFWGATAKSQWLVYTAEAEGEAFGPLNRPGPMQRLVPQIVQAGAYTPGTYYIPAFSTDSATRVLYDVRRFRNVLFTCSAGNLTLTDTPTFSLFLDLWPGLNGVGGVENYETVAAGSSNDLAATGGGLAWIQVGADSPEAEGDHWGSFPSRFPYVSPRLVIGGAGEVDFDGAVYFDLWGIP